MHWLTIHIDTVHDGLEPVAAMLSALGVDNIAVDDETEFREFLEDNRQIWDYVDEKLEQDMRGRSRVTFYLPEDETGFAKLAESRIALQSLREARPDCGPLLMTLETVQDSDWENNWKQYYKPLPIGEKLLIIPQWETADPQGRIPVVLDPGLTFGTGNHETTRLCLAMLESQIRGGERVLDLGCGSGILSIAALQLGAASAVAVDIDPACIHVAAENAAYNNIGPDRLTVLSGNVLSDAALREQIPPRAFDMVLANIVADVIMGLAPAVPDWLAPGGQFLCSGIIGPRAEQTAAVLRQNGFRIADTACENDWYAYRCVREA